MTIETTHTAFLNGREVSQLVAIEVAARMLNASKQPLFAGLGTDIEGARAVIALAEATSGVYDHAHSGGIFNTLAVMQSDGFMHTTPGEIRLRAEVVLLVGPQIEQAWPNFWHSLSLDQPPELALEPKSRKSMWLVAEGQIQSADFNGESIVCPKLSLLSSLSVLRSLIAGRRVAASHALISLADTLKAAKIGAIMYVQAALNPLETEMLSGMVRDLNRITRFSCLPLAPPANAQGVTLASGWMTGFAPRTSFSNGFPVHDPILLNGERLLASHEIDLTVWIDAFGDLSPPENLGNCIAVTSRSVRFSSIPRVHFHVGTPGVDHSAVLWSPEIAGLQAFPANAASALPSIASVLQALASKADERGHLP